jgi:hypothetical protein
MFGNTATYDPVGEVARSAGEGRRRTRLTRLKNPLTQLPRDHFGARIQSNLSSAAFFGAALVQFASLFMSPFPV